MPDIILTVVSGEPIELGLSIPGVQGPMGQSTLPSGGAIGQIAVKASAADYDATWTSTLSGITVKSSTLSGIVIAGTASGGTFLSPTITGATIDLAIFNGGAADGGALSNAIVDNCSIDNSTFEDGTIFDITLSGTITNNATLSGGTFTSATLSSPVVISPTISGNITASGGVIVFGSGASAGFFGASPVVCPSGIAIPANTGETVASLSGLIVALRNLGLIRQ